MLPKSVTFQSTLPVWGATPNGVLYFWHNDIFQSTLPGWGATALSLRRLCVSTFHSPLPVWGAPTGNTELQSAEAFQSTLPVWGATGIYENLVLCVEFQSTLPVWGATHANLFLTNISVNFNPRSPCGERPSWADRVVRPYEFQSTLPVGGATIRQADSGANFEISIHAPRVGSDAIG